MDSLDHALLTEVIARTSPTAHDLCALACLSRKWKEACYSPLLWRAIRADGEVRGNLYGEGLEHIAGRCGELQQLSLTNVHILERPNPWMHHNLELLLEKAGPRLKRLKLQFAFELPFTDRLLAAIGRCCPNLESFDLSAANYFATDAAIATFLRACPSVAHFRCYVRTPSPIHAPGDTLLWQIAKKWPHLRTLEINGNHVTENGIFALQDCQHLEELSFHGYSRGVFDRAKSAADGSLTIMKSLQLVSFFYQLPTAAEFKRLLRMCPKLEQVKLYPLAGDDHGDTLQAVAQAERPEVDVHIRSIDPENPRGYSLVDVASRLGTRIDKY